MPSFNDTLRTWRRRLKAALPYVRRREYRVLQEKYAALIDAIDGRAGPASDAALHFANPLPPDLAGEVCLFVTHADAARIKPHVIRHVARLADAGIDVIVIVNTDVPAEQLVIDGTMLERARGIAIRQNLGYDFGAWAHLLALCPGAEPWTRLYLVNDSIVGPLNRADFERIIARIRASSADVVGLTEALLPRRHLQ